MTGTENILALGLALAPVLVLVLALGYLLGSIPFGLLIARMAGHGDIRNMGSGNIGATNVLRTGSKTLAILTLLLDMGKAAAAALIAEHFFGPNAALVAGGAALLGHCYPLWLKFKGGKGVATYFGVLLFVSWPIGLLAFAVWLAAMFLTRIVSLSGIITAAFVPIIAYYMGYPKVAVLCAVLGAIIILRHRENIGRILAKTEPKIGTKK